MSNRGSAPTPGSLCLVSAKKLVIGLNAAARIAWNFIVACYFLFMFAAVSWVLYTEPGARVVLIAVLIFLTAAVAVLKWWDEITEWAEERA